MMWSCDFFGRKANIQFGAFFSLFGGALQAGANSLQYVAYQCDAISQTV